MTAGRPDSRRDPHALTASYATRPLLPADSRQCGGFLCPSVFFSFAPCTTFMFLPNEPVCTDRYEFWASTEGKYAFSKMVRERGAIPQYDETCQFLQGAIVGGSLCSDEELNTRVAAAADDLALRILHADHKARAFSRFVTRPQPPRHATYAGADDRGPRELAFAEHLSTSAQSRYWSDFVGNMQGHRASGRLTRLSTGVAQDSAEV